MGNLTRLTGNFIDIKDTLIECDHYRDHPKMKFKVSVS